MSSSPASTAADRALLDELAARGLHATPRQVKRWREAGVLAPPLQRSAGRGRGRPSLRYPPEALDQATAILDLLAHRVPLDEMAVAMFLRGAPVTETAVRAAFLAMLQPVARLQEGDEEARESAAEQLVGRLLLRARRMAPLDYWSRRARGYGDRPRVVLGDALTALTFRVVVGTTPSLEAAAATAHILDIPPEEVEDVFEQIGEVSPGALRRTARTVTLHELQAARRTLIEAVADAPSTECTPNFQAAGLIVLGVASVARAQHEERASKPGRNQ